MNRSYQEETLSLSPKDIYFKSPLQGETPALPVVLIIMAVGQASLSQPMTSLVLARWSCVSSGADDVLYLCMFALEYLIMLTIKLSFLKKRRKEKEKKAFFDKV